MSMGRFFLYEMGKGVIDKRYYDRDGWSKQ